MTKLLPDVDMALIVAAIEGSEDGGEQAFLNLLSGAGEENEYLEVEAHLKAAAMKAMPMSATATAPGDSKRWQDRQDVIDGGFVASLDSKTVKRQEAIAEVVFLTRARFLTTPRVFISTMPLHTHTHTRAHWCVMRV